MRIVIGGDQFWPCHKLAAAVLHRMTARYGPDIVIVHGDDTGASESFALTAKGQRIKAEEHVADFDQLGDGAIRFRNHAMLRGAGLCVIVHRSILDAGTKDLARQAIEAGVPTYLIDSDDGADRSRRRPSSKNAASALP
jgi:hypothetical protein